MPKGTSQPDETWLKKELNELRSASFTMALVVFAAIGCLIGYFFLSESFLTGPFTRIAYARTPIGIEVDVETKVPARMRVEYGTSREYLNRMEMGKDFETEHSTNVVGLLPGKTHFFRVVLEDQRGQLHTSSFYTVK